jgi:hypothetical protein
MWQRLVLPAVLLSAAATAGHSNAQAAQAVLLTSVSPAHCVASQRSRTAPDPLRCPGALRAALVEAETICREAGGTLAGADEGVVFAVDVNDDGRNELAFELDGNASCEGAWSVFSCGSLGCPKALYELRDGEWAVIGELSATAPEEVTLAAKAARNGYRTLEVCAQQDCTERWIHEWLGTTYDATRVEVRGARVDVASSIHGLHPLAAATTVSAAPSARARELGRYDAGTEVAIIGTLEDGSYYYISPCNACESGFVPKAAVAVR